MPRGQSLRGRMGWHRRWARARLLVSLRSPQPGHNPSFIQGGSPVAPRFVLRLQGQCQVTQERHGERGEGPPAALTASPALASVPP